MVVTAMGSIALGVNTSYGPLIIGNIVAAVAGLVLELFLFSVDYARSERLQFEDDEYYYYVKAIPKVAMTTPEKTVKKINERQETEIIDAEAVKRCRRIRRKKRQKPSIWKYMRDMDRKEKQNGSRHTVMQTTEVRHRSGQVRQESIRRREDRHRKSMT